jgi:hypothetical protein
MVGLHIEFTGIEREVMDEVMDADYGDGLPVVFWLNFEVSHLGRWAAQIQFHLADINEPPRWRMRANRLGFSRQQPHSDWVSQVDDEVRWAAKQALTDLASANLGQRIAQALEELNAKKLDEIAESMGLKSQRFRCCQRSEE